MKIQKKLIFSIILGLVLISWFSELASADVNKTVLANGLTVITKEDHYQPIVALQMWVNVGSADETEFNSGVSHFTEHMLFKGTSNLKATDLARIIESKGGIINAATSKDFTYYHIVISSQYLASALDVLADAIMNANFPLEELEKERLVILEEIKRRYDSPQAHLWDLFNKNIYKNHSYSRTVLGPADIIEGMSRKMLLEHYHKFYVPGNMSLIIVGDFDSQNITSKVKDIFKSFKRKKLKDKTSKSVKQDSIDIEETRKTEHAYLLLGMLGPKADNKDQYAMDTLNYVLGGGRSSRLYRKLVEEEKLAYSIGVSFLTLREEGPFYISAVCEPAKIPLVKQTILDEFIKIKKKPISKEELNRAKTMLKSGYLLGNQTYADQAFTLGYYETIYKYEFTQSYISKIDEVTINDILNVVDKYINLDKVTSVVITPASGEEISDE